MRAKILLGSILFVAACNVSNETAVRSYNGKTVEVELYGDTFAFGTEQQKAAQIAAAKAQAEDVCGGPARFLSRRIEEKPQNGIYYVPGSNLALFQCIGK